MTPRFNIFFNTGRQWSLQICPCFGSCFARNCERLWFDSPPLTWASASGLRVYLPGFPALGVKLLQLRGITALDATVTMCRGGYLRQIERLIFPQTPVNLALSFQVQVLGCNVFLCSSHRPRACAFSRCHWYATGRYSLQRRADVVHQHLLPPTLSR